MPRKRRRISAFFKILTVLTLVCGGLVAGGYYVMQSIKPIDLTPPPPPSGCTVASGDGTDDLDLEQGANAATIGGVAFSKDLPDHAVVVAYATVWQESKFHNIEHGDRDSLGLFQQRPSMEWGDPGQIIDPVYSSGEFYDKLVEIPDYRELPVYEAAQAVQRSADGFAYDQHERRSRAMMSAFTGQDGPAVTCWFEEDAGNAENAGNAEGAGVAEEGAGPDVAAAQEEMLRVFGTDPAQLPVAEQPRTGDLGWAMALWAVTHAQEYGLSSVTYGDQRWSAADGRAGWSAVEGGPAPEGQVVLD
ncbi:hypothetical protein HDA32_000823 [Spinactinospora alkalitolerans]|uniref:Uncharacterized protein n=1 Tax=Spinactinospora alkalitolerans TaxID=687207 RepID=A0A852TSI9_9ACTN|nr:hypothetical protein [Spinactinospora alkalitolerans]NYE45703.1 hypothetical protein [Spinactinospora alkalitolerans]